MKTVHRKWYRALLIVVAMLGVIYFSISLFIWGAVVFTSRTSHDFSPTDWGMLWHATPTVLFWGVFLAAVSRARRYKPKTGWLILIAWVASGVCSWFEIKMEYYQLQPNYNLPQYYFTWWPTFLQPIPMEDYKIKCGVIDTQGNMVVPPIYDSIRNFNHGWAIVELQDSYGFIRRDGQVMIEPQFDQAEDFSEDLAAVAIENDQGKTLWGYINPNGQMAITPQFAQAKPFSEGLAFAGIETVGTMEIATKDTKKRPRQVSSYIRSGYIDKTGHMVIDTGPSVGAPFSEGLASIRRRDFSYIDPNGSEIIAGPFCDADSFKNGLARVSFAMAGIGDFTYTDRTGRLITKERFHEADPFSEGLAAVKGKGGWGFIDTHGDWAIKPQYRGAGSFYGGLAAIKKGSLWGYVNRTGTMVIPAQFDEVGDFSEGLACVQTDNHRWGYRQIIRRKFIDTSGRIIMEMPYHEIHYGMSGYDGHGPRIRVAFSEGLANINQDAKWGYIDKTGTIIIPPIYEWASKFMEGRALVGVTAGEKKHYIEPSPIIEECRDEPFGLIIGVIVVCGLMALAIFVKAKPPPEEKTEPPLR